MICSPARPCDHSKQTHTSAISSERQRCHIAMVADQRLPPTQPCVQPPPLLPCWLPTTEASCITCAQGVTVCQSHPLSTQSTIAPPSPVFSSHHHMYAAPTSCPLTVVLLHMRCKQSPGHQTGCQHALQAPAGARYKQRSYCQQRTRCSSYSETGLHAPAGLTTGTITNTSAHKGAVLRQQILAKEGDGVAPKPRQRRARTLVSEYELFPKRDGRGWKCQAVRTSPTQQRYTQCQSKKE
jgi:hypothetical protein